MSLRTTNAYTGLYALDAFDVTDRFTVTAGGRFNVADIRLEDQLGTALNGGSDYSRFNPLVGATYKITPELRPTPAIPRPTARRRRWSSAAPIRCIPASSPPSWSRIPR